jgi:hypothetical protein
MARATVTPPTGPAAVAAFAVFAAFAVHLMTNFALTGATYGIDRGQQLVSGE